MNWKDFVGHLNVEIGMDFVGRLNWSWGRVMCHDGRGEKTKREIWRVLTDCKYLRRDSNQSNAITILGRSFIWSSFFISTTKCFRSLFFPFQVYHILLHFTHCRISQKTLWKLQNLTEVTMNIIESQRNHYDYYRVSQRLL